MEQKLNSIINRITNVNEDIKKQAEERLLKQAKPAGSLGRLEIIAAQLASITGSLNMHLNNKKVVVCAGDHGVVAKGISLFPQEVTPQMVLNFTTGGASINVLAKHAGAEVLVADLGVNFDFDPNLEIIHTKVAKATNDISEGPAMTRDQAIQSIISGINIVEELVANNELDLLATGDMGIGNTTPSTAIIAAFSEIDVEELTGRGTGIGDEALHNKIEIIKKALNVNQPDKTDAIDILAKVGGFEIGGLAGLVLGAAANKIPVICDGLISTAGALIACKLAPKASQYLFAGHRSFEVGHKFMHKELGVEPLLDLGMRLGEGTGAALSMEILDASTRVLSDIRLFEEVNIGDKNDESEYIKEN